MRTLFSVLILVSVVLSCKKETEPPITPVVPPSLSTPPEILLGDAYVGNRIKTLMVGLLDLSHDNDFVGIVNQRGSPTI